VHRGRIGRMELSRKLACGNLENSYGFCRV
jgi:hypothetical protein